MDFRRSPGETAKGYADANAKLLAESQKLCEHLLPGGSRVGNEYVCADLSGGAGRSFSVNLTTGKWADFSAGLDGGDLINLWAAVNEVEQHQAKSEALEWLGDEKPGKLKSRRTDELRGTPADTIWEYVDADGHVVAQVKRWNATAEYKKEIRPFDPNTEQYKMPDTDNRPLLYLDKILGSTGPVVFVGGEKCADAIKNAGWVGTTNMGGESAIGRTDLEPLADRDVIVWPDNDAAGEKWAAKITAKLREVGAATVRVVEIPEGVPAKWDAADADLVQRQAILQRTLKSTPVSRGLVFWSAEELTQGEPPAREWITEGTVPRGVPSVIFGPGGIGKSLAILDLCVKVATRERYGGEISPGCNTVLGAVPLNAAGATIYVTLEDDKAELHRRLRAIDPGNNRKGAPFFIVPGLDIEGFEPGLIRQENKAVELTRLALRGLPDLIRKVEKRAGAAPKVLGLDPAGDFVDGSEDDATIIKPLMRYLRELASRFNIAIVLIGHTSKGQSDADKVVNQGMRGSGAWTANSRFAYGMYRPAAGAAIRFLKEINLEPNDENIERVVFGKIGKANQSKSFSGVKKYLQNADTGLPEDMTAAVQEAQATPKGMKDQFLLAVEAMAKAGTPFTQSAHGASGAYGPDGTNRIYLPPGPLQQAGKEKLQALAAELLTEDRIKRVKWGGGTKGAWYLDVSGGPVANNTIEAAAEMPDISKLYQE